MDERTYYLLFSLSPGIGPKRFSQLISTFGSAQNAWGANKNDLQDAGISGKLLETFLSFRERFDVSNYLKQLEKKQVTFITLADSAYPPLLKKIPNPPIGLFAVGNLNNLSNLNRSLAVVGNRKMTSYGKSVTEKLVAELVTYGFTIVSGLALGIDAAAHKITLENGGKTIAVLGCGVDCCNPRESQQLYNQIIEAEGAIISEYPLGQLPNKGTFPARNRIIAGISLGTLVTEAGVDSGSLITAEEGRLANRPVFAVPGPITSQQSAGTARLLKSGAHLVTSAKDILQILNISSHNSSKKLETENLLPEEKKIVETLQQEPLILDELAKKVNLPVTKTSIIVSALEMRGILKNLEGGKFGISS